MLSTIRILIVDADADQARAARQLLEHAGYLTSGAVTGAEALRSVRAERQQLVLLDHHLPDMDGIAVCQQIKADPALAGTLVVMASASRVSEPERIDGLAAGAVGYIVRPIGNQELIARVEAFVRILRLHEAYRAQAIALRDSVERFTLAARATNDAIWDWNLSTDALWWNENFQTLFGYGPDEIEPRLEAWARLIHPDDLERVETGLRDAITGLDTRWTDEYRFRRKDGSYADVLDRGFISRDAGGRAVRAVGAMADLSARRRAELAAIEATAEANRLREVLARQFVELQAANKELVASRRAALNLMDDAIEAQGELRESEERFRRAVLDSPIPIMLHAEDGTVIQTSESWCDITGYTPEELATIGDWTERAYGERQPLVQADIDRLYELDHPIAEGDYPVRTKSGATRIWEFNSAPLGRLRDGRRLVISMALDVTERRHAEQKLQEQLNELQRWNAATLGREARVIELKQEVNRLLEASGQPARYASANVAPDGEVPHG